MTIRAKLKDLAPGTVFNADRLFFFNVLRGNIKANFQTYQFTENDIGRSVFLTLEEAEKAVA